jgi:hypothetical protein
LPRAPSVRLTAEIVAAHAGEQALCLAAAGLGRRWGLHAERPGVELNALVTAEAYGVPGPLVTVEPEPPALAVVRVDIRGPIDETAGFVQGESPCEGAWVDGNDAISERLCAAFAEGDVLLCVHSPGGNPTCAREGIRRALEAKAAHGRRCIVHSEGMAASLALWWALSLADEFFATPDAQIGSIGCRGAHMSIAGALAQEGLVPTFSAWPDEGKVAGVAELPLSPLGKARNDRDVAAIGEAFAAACIGGPVGQRLGLTLETIVGLHADVLTGTAAAGVLTDGIATLEDTAAWALASAGTGTGDTMTIKAEGGEKPPEKKPDEETAAEGKQPDGVCKGCGYGQRPEAKFCDQCGASMAAAPMEDDDEQPDSSKRPGALAARRPTATVSAARPGSALASIPALRTALSRSDALLDQVASMVGAKGHAEILGALEPTVADAGKAKRYRDERNTANARAAARERMDLLASLYTQDPTGHPRGKLVVDVVEDVKDAQGRVTSSRVVDTRPAELWSDGPKGRTLENLRAYTRATLAGLPASQTSPYDKAPLETNEAAAKALATQQNANGAARAPGVRAAVRAGVKDDEAAAIYAREFGRTA